MKILSVKDPAFRPYGQIVENFPVEEILEALAETPLPDGVGYVPTDPVLQELPAAVEVYATTLHYAPCHVDPEKGFRVLVALPWGTNTEKPALLSDLTREDRLLWACNKWLLAHPESSEAAEGAYVGLSGVNLDVAAE